MTRRPRRNPEHFPRASNVALALVAMLFVAMRLLTAWMLRFEVNGDLAIVQMMVRDMTSGGPIPTFFYGQAYMGSLEPVVNTLFHLLFGRTNFGLELGTAFFVVLMAIAVARMARRAGGAWAAVASLALCAIGPLPFAHYAVSPRGGYGVLLFTTAGLLDIGAQLICEERREERCRFALPLAAGLLAGIGFWCNQLVFPAVATVALCILILVPRLLARLRLWIGGILGFAVGSAPFWIWNARNGWESFGLAGSLVFDSLSTARNARLLANARWPALFGVSADTAPGVPRVLLAAIIAASLLLPLLSLRAFAPLPKRIHPDEHPATPEARTQLVVCWAYLAIFALCFACSDFAIFDTPRYLLPVIPIVAVLAGAACTSTRFRSANALAIAFLLLLVAWQAEQMKALAAIGRDGAARMAGYSEAAALLESKGVDVAYCPFRYNSLNLCGTGSVAFTDSNLERIPAFRRRAELADSPAIVDDFLGMARWTVASGGSLCTTNVGGLRIMTDVVPPPGAVEEIPLKPEDIAANGQTGVMALTDRNFASCWEFDGDRCEIDISFHEPRPVCGARLLASGLGDADVRIMGRSAPQGSFRDLSPRLPNVKCRWSGPRLYPEDDCPPLELRFPTETVEGIRIHLRAPVTDGAIRKIREIQLLAPTSLASPATPAEWHDAVDAFIALLRRQGVNRLYAGRWVANAVSEKTKGAIWTNHGQDLHPKATGAPAPHTRPAPVTLDAFTAFLVSPSGVLAMRAALKSCWLNMREVPAGMLGVLFITESIQPSSFTDGTIGLRFDPDCPTFLPSAAWEEENLANPPNIPNVTWPEGYPHTVPFFRYFLEWRPTDNEVYRHALDLLTEPTIGDVARFAGGNTWRGARLLEDSATDSVRGAIRLRHYWSSSRNVLPDGRRYLVFTHFIGPGGYRFQDIYPLDIPPEGPDTTGREGLKPTSLTLNPDSTSSAVERDVDVLWHVDRRIAIPADAPPGLYEMRLGLVDALYPERRLPLETRLTHRRRAIIVNPVFAVGSANNKETPP